MSSRRLATLFTVGLGAARLVEGVVGSVVAHRFVANLGDPDPTPAAMMGFRMKSGRDIALGLLTLSAIGDQRRLAELAATATVIDLIDGAAVVLDARQAFPERMAGGAVPFRVFPTLAVTGFGVAAVAAWAATVLGSPSGGR